ncbi:MAG TPA: LamG-like jellyroll fold domain-containing protein [Rhodothermales bacterium]|nr:LamG-like jellyroll fold domain-containing protein [Rhodothermales bacterium]
MYVCLALLLAANPAYAQFRQVTADAEVQVGQHANLFAYWDGRSAFEGAFVTLPTGWVLEEALTMRQGEAQVPLMVRRLDRPGNVYGIAASHALPGPQAVILGVVTGGSPGAVTWTLTPFVRRHEQDRTRLVPLGGQAITQGLRQMPSVRAEDNQVLAFRAQGRPLQLRRTALPDLSTQAPSTVEFWMRTTDFNEIVLSTWNGGERTSYPIEMIVDGEGLLRYYRGQPGRHEAMATHRPVADGQWHHIAVTNDPATGWARLFFDGQAADSLYSPVPPAIRFDQQVALGGRLPNRDAVKTHMQGYTGLFDEVRFWPQARTGDALQQTMRELLPPTAGAVFLSFDEPLPERLIADRPSRIERTFSDLAFYQPVKNIRAVPEAGDVVVTWQTTDTQTRSFVVERSSDGRTFMPIGEVDVTDATQADRAAGLFTYRDTNRPDRVAFYRVRQHFASGAERTSAAIKLGMARNEEENVVLLGNFPNPFNPTTTIAYDVREAQQVRLAVWDLSGQQVRLLVNRTQQPGHYEVRFDATELPSGTYFVRLSTRQSTQSHKMILTK